MAEKNTTPKPLLRFRVYTDPRLRYRKTAPFYWCTLWSTVPQAKARMSTFDLAGWETAVGACLSWDTRDYSDKREPGTLLPEMGEIVLADRYSGSSTIAHECAHAAHRLIERMVKYSIKDTDPINFEERFCLTVGWMTRQIVRRLVAREKVGRMTRQIVRRLVAREKRKNK